MTDIQVLPSNQTQSQSIIIKNQKGVMARKNYHGPAQVGQGLGVEFNSANPMNKTISNGFNQPQLQQHQTKLAQNRGGSQGDMLQSFSSQ